MVACIRANSTLDKKEAFLCVGFTHHRKILTKAKDFDERGFFVDLNKQDNYRIIPFWADRFTDQLEAVCKLM